MTESQIIYLYELYITGLCSTSVCNVRCCWEETDFISYSLILKTSVSQWRTCLSQIPYQKALLWITCPALFPPPHFGTLSKIQKGGEPVPQPVEDQQCLRRSVYKWNWHMSACVLCIVRVFVCIRVSQYLLYILSQWSLTLSVCPIWSWDHT